MWVFLIRFKLSLMSSTNTYKNIHSRILFFHNVDENYAVQHNSRGILGMANKGRHTNASQFYITFQPAPWMDTKYVAFGWVLGKAWYFWASGYDWWYVMQHVKRGNLYVSLYFIPGGGVLLPKLYVDVPAGPQKFDSLHTNFLHNYPPISIPFNGQC